MSNEKNINKDNIWYKFYTVDKNIKIPDLTIYELIEETSKRYPNYIAYEYYGKKVTYKKFINDINTCANSLINIGVKENEVVTICMPNTPIAVTVFYAISKIGAIASMIHPLSSQNEIDFYLKESNSKYIFTNDVFCDKVINYHGNISKIIISSISYNMSIINKILYKITDNKKYKVIKSDKVILYSDFIKLADGLVETVKKKQNDDAIILYSGGTTGTPKGVVLSNRNFNSLAIQASIVCNRAKAGDSILGILPMFHAFGLGVSIHTALYIGGKIVLVPDFNSKKFGRLIKKYKPNFITGVPTLFEALLKSKLSKNDLNNLNSVICGGDILTPNLKKQIDNYLKEHGATATVRCGYGLTECTGASCFNPEGEYRDNSIGIPLPDVNYKIVEIGTTNELGPNLDGEICISGSTVMKGYLNNKEETDKIIKKHKDGLLWLHTGDIGYKDSEGFIYFKQRLKRMIISSGYNIYPSYLEELIGKHKAIEKCAVIGIPHKYKKQVVKVYIVLKKEYQNNEKIKDEIKTYCEENLAKYSWPYVYEYKNELPITKIGKIDYKEL